MSDYRRWLGAVVCFFLVSALFVILKGKMVTVVEYGVFAQRGETSLLLYIVPGFIASSLSRGRRVLNPFIGAATAMMSCMLIHYGSAANFLLWQEIAYAVSVVFWCLFGTFIYLFVFTAYTRKRSLS